jgi:hypothetical protein
MDQGAIVAMQDRFLDDMEAILAESASTGRSLRLLPSAAPGAPGQGLSTPEIVARLSA